MHQPAWREIESFYSLPSVNQQVVEQFRKLKSSQDTHTKKEGNPSHYCAFFLPIHRASNSIYLGHHIKAADWIPPGGHVDPGETPCLAAIREMQEELAYSPSPRQLTPHALSVKPINRLEVGCQAHYDVWYLVEMENKFVFKFDPREYHTANWFLVSEGLKQIKHNPDFAGIISAVLS